jgi:hypothetical protein
MDEKLISALEIIQKQVNLEYINEIIKLIYKGQLYRDKIDEILKKYDIIDYKEAEEKFLDLIIFYINYILRDDKINESEYYNIAQLKRLFKIRQGDFYTLRANEIKEIIMKQIYTIYADNQIEEFEAIHKSKLQELFDLSYDQMNEFLSDEIKRILMEGGDISKLDVYYQLPKIPDI